MTGYLFVGGPKDGERILLQEPRLGYDVPVYDRCLDGIKVHHYHLKAIFFGTAYLTLYASFQVSDEEVLNALLSNYRLHQEGSNV